MGRLINVRDLKKGTADLSAFWYFKDTYYRDEYKFEFPSDNFPYKVFIHREDIDLNRLDIRKWIERTVDDTVIYDIIDKSYRVWWSEDPNKKDWEHTSEIRNEWYLFCFEDSESALAFSLRFSDIVRPMTDDHPTRHHGERYQR